MGSRFYIQCARSCRISARGFATSLPLFAPGILRPSQRGKLVQECCQSPSVSYVEGTGHHLFRVSDPSLLGCCWRGTQELTAAAAHKLGFHGWFAAQRRLVEDAWMSQRTDSNGLMRPSPGGAGKARVRGSRRDLAPDADSTSSNLTARALFLHQLLPCYYCAHCEGIFF